MKSKEGTRKGEIDRERERERRNRKNPKRIEKEAENIFFSGDAWTYVSERRVRKEKRKETQKR